jgi:cell cycle checkpoint control protein RAD9A
MLQGVLKTYRLTFESVSPMHALFVKESANNSWSISSRALREFVEHFGPGTEQLDIYLEDGRVSLTSYTEKIMSGNGKIINPSRMLLMLIITTEVLKQPLHTTIAIDTLEFGEFTVEEKLHIVISVKDFKSIISHAGTINTTVKARYSHPSSPMQLTYSDEGVTSEFILMTTGESRGTSSAPASRANSKRPASRPPLEATPSSKRPANSDMRPPSASAAPSVNREAMARSKVSRPSPPPPQPSIQTDALFFPEADDDRRWDPVNFDEEEDEMLLWDAGGNSVSLERTLGSY